MLRKFIVILTNLALRLKLIDRYQYFIPIRQGSNAIPIYNSDTVYSFNSNGNLLSSSFIVFKDFTLAIYSLILYCTTYLDFNVYCSINGFYRNNKLETFDSVKSFSFYDIPSIYDYYIRKFGDIGNVKFTEIEKAIYHLFCQYISAYVNDFITDNTVDKDKLLLFLQKHNITSFSNDELSAKLSIIIDTHINKSEVDKNEL